MNSTRSNWFQNHILYKTPLYVRGACGNFHPVWKHHCHCYGDGLIRDVTTGYVLMTPDIQKDGGAHRAFADGVSDMLYGGELGWLRKGDNTSESLKAMLRDLRRQWKVLHR